MINAVLIPINKINISEEVNTKPNFNIFNKDAPNITGIAKKKVYSAAILLSSPSINPP